MLFSFQTFAISACVSMVIEGKRPESDKKRANMGVNTDTHAHLL